MKYDHLFEPEGPNFRGIKTEFDQRCIKKESELDKELTKAEVVAGTQKETKRAMRTFETGATRDDDETKPDYEGYLSPLVIQRFGEYMTKHRKQADGKLRDSDNWQKGIPIAAYMKSLWRHLVELWAIHRKYRMAWPPPLSKATEIEDALCAIIFNASGYLHEILKRDAIPDGTGIPVELYDSYTGKRKT